MKINIIGNGIIGLMTAFKLINTDNTVSLNIIGPSKRDGSASLAAAAMFNSFCEVENDTLANDVEKKKWLLNTKSNNLWKELIKQIENLSGKNINHGFGTFLINNTGGGSIEDENYDSIIRALNEYKQSYEIVDPKEINNYNPSPKSRALRSVYINNEGWVNPSELINALEIILERCSQIKFINKKAKRIIHYGDSFKSVELDGGDIIESDKILICNGANFSELVDKSNLTKFFPRIFYGVGTTISLNTGINTTLNCIRTPNRGLACGTYTAPQSISSTLIGASNNVTTNPSLFPKVTSTYTLLKNAMEQINTNYYNATIDKITTGYRPVSEDNIPLIGRMDSIDLLIVTGTKRDGFHSSPYISDYISDLVLHNTSEIELDHIFKPERNLNKYLTRSESISKYVKHKIDAHFQHDFEPSKDSMIENLIDYHTVYANDLHDKYNAIDWGIPIDIYPVYNFLINKKLQE